MYIKYQLDEISNSELVEIIESLQAKLDTIEKNEGRFDQELMEKEVELCNELSKRMEAQERYKLLLKLKERNDKRMEELNEDKEFNRRDDS